MAFKDIDNSVIKDNKDLNNYYKKLQDINNSLFQIILFIGNTQANESLFKNRKSLDSVRLRNILNDFIYNIDNSIKLNEKVNKLNEEFKQLFSPAK